MDRQDYFTPTGLVQALTALVTNNVNPFFDPFPAQPGRVVRAATRTAVEANLTQLNAAITSAAKGAGAQVFDLQAVFHNVRQNGLTIGNQTLTADYLGGFYSLDGYYPERLDRL